MGNEEETDFELEMLRQAALSSLQKNRAKKGSSQHRTTASNKNLIEIQTSTLLEEEEDDPECEEIVIAEGLDVNDSDCDEVIEEVMLSDGDDISGRNSPTSSEDPQRKPNSLESNPSEGSQAPAVGGGDDDSSSDDDALSVASRYSLYDDEPADENNSLSRLPNRLRPAAQTKSAKDEELTNHQRTRRTRSRSRERLVDRDRSPFQSMGRGGRRRRSRTRTPPFRRRTRRSRSRSHGREFRRRSLSRDRDRDPPHRDVRDRPRRKEDSRRPTRASPSPPLKSSSRRDAPSRRRSRSSSRDKTSNRNTDVNLSNSNRPSSKKSEPSTDSRQSPEPAPLSGADQEVLEKRRRKFQDQIPLNRVVEGKKIRLQSKVVEKEKEARDEAENKRSRTKSVQKPSAILKDKDSSNSSSDFTEKSRPSKESSSKDSKDSSKESSKNSSSKSRKLDKDDNDDEVNEEDDLKDSEPKEEEDLRAKLIKRKMKAQQQGNLGSGRIFTEALKGTRLISNKESSSSSSSSRKGLKRKVSLTFA